AGSARCQDGPGWRGNGRPGMLAVTVSYRSLRRVFLTQVNDGLWECAVPQANELRAGRDGAADRDGAAGRDGATGPRRARRLAWTLLGVTVALLAASPAIGLTGGESWNTTLGFIPVALAFAVVGALVAARTGNRLGWLFLAAAATSGATGARKGFAAG